MSVKPRSVNKKRSDKNKDLTSSMIDILVEVIKCCQSPEVGADGALLALKQTHLNNGKTGGKQLSDYIIKSCCDEFEITRASLSRSMVRKGKERRLRGDRAQAVSFIYVLHKTYMKMNAEEISDLFGHGYKNVWRQINDFESLSSNNKVDLITLKRFNKVTDKVNQFIESNKNNVWQTNPIHTNRRGATGIHTLFALLREYYFHNQPNNF